MPFPMKIQPIDPEREFVNDPVVVKLPAPKSRLKRLFERQFPGILRTTSGERIFGAGDGKERDRDGGPPGGADLEPSSVCLAKMVQNFLEESNDRPPRCGRRRCNCFNGKCDDMSGDEFDPFGDDWVSTSPPGDSSEFVRNLVCCTSAVERSLLAEASRIVEKSDVKGAKDESKRRAVVDGLIALGYNASICKSRWEKSPSLAAGEYEYIDVIVVDGGERVLIDIDFLSEFEIARSTKSYRAVLQAMPPIFVGKVERLQQIVAVVSEAARQSMKKKGMHIPPWRKSEYMRAKWLSPYERITPTNPIPDPTSTDGGCGGNTKVVIGSSGQPKPASSKVLPGELDLRLEKSGEPAMTAPAENKEVVTVTAATPEWQPPEVNPKAPTPRGTKVVAGLSSII